MDKEYIVKLTNSSVPNDMKLIGVLKGTNSDGSNNNYHMELLDELVHCKDCKYNKWCVKQMYIVNRPKQGKRKNGFEKYDNLFPEVDFCSFGEKR